MLKTCTSKPWLIALVATLLAGSQAFAQSARPNTEVKVRKGSIVVKKVMKNGEVVDEDVQVFGDLDDETRRRVLDLIEKCCPKGGAKCPGKNDAGKKADDDGRGACKDCRDKDCRKPQGGFLILGPDGDCPLGAEVRKHLEETLREHGLGHGRHVFRLPGYDKTGRVAGDWERMGERIRRHVEQALRQHGLDQDSALPRQFEERLKQFGGGKLPGGVRIFKRGPGGSWAFPQGPGGGATTEGRIRVEINGETVLDKQIQPGGKAGPGTQRLRPREQTAPRRAAPRGDASSLDAIRRLERNIQRMQRELEALKRDLGKPRPIRLERGSAPARDL